MTDHLFRSSWYYSWKLVLRQAAADVEMLDPKVFLGSGLSSQLDKIADDYSLEIARIDETGIRTTQRETEWVGKGLRGEQRSFRRLLLDVTIPFSGDAETFRIAP